MIDAKRLAELVLADADKYLTAALSLQDPANLSSIADIHANWPLPSLEELELVIDASFWATLLNDEGRSTRFRLGIGPVPKAFATVVTHNFTNPPALTADNLRRVAAGVDPESAYLSVEFANGIPQIANIVAHSSRLLDRPFTIHADPRGDLQFSWLQMRLLRYRGGIVEHSYSLPTDNRAITREFVSHFGVNGDSSMAYTRILNSATDTVRRHGHGGAIWIRGTRQAPPEDNSMTINFPVEHEQVDAASIDLVKLDEEGCWAPSIGQLTSVDGAVMLDRVGQLIGFGIYLKADDLPRVTKVGDSRTKRVIEGKDVGGGRHQSALAFCNTHPGSMAIVVSQDGGMSIFRSDDSGEVTLVPWSPLGFDFPTS